MARGSTSQYSKKKNAELEFYTIDVLAEQAGHYLTIDQIKMGNPYELGGVSSQKMSRVLSNLIMMGVVKKKKNGLHMTYTTRIVKAGYEVCELQQEEDDNELAAVPASATKINWEMQTELIRNKQEGEG